MQNIMGLVTWVKKHSKAVSRVLLLMMIMFDVYLAGLIYGPIEFARTAEAWGEKVSSLTTKIAKPSPTPSAIVPDKNNETITIDPSITPISSSSPTSLPTSSTSPTPSSSPSTSSDPTPTTSPSSTPTPVPTNTPTPTPTASPTPTPTPLPTTTPTQPVTSSVYIKSFVYANNQQLVAEQYPVKVFNSETNETLYTAETDQSGTSPVWQIAANTPIKVVLYPKPGFQGCGDSWSLTIGTLGTMESHDLSIQGDRTPCIK